MSSWSIRFATADDVDAVLELWMVADAQPSVTDNAPALRSMLAHDSQALLIADSPAGVIGSLIAVWNGWRGSFYRLAVHPDHRRRGLATSLVREGEKRLLQLGAARLDAIVVSHEGDAISFWSSAGYDRQQDRSRFVRNF